MLTLSNEGRDGAAMQGNLQEVAEAVGLALAADVPAMIWGKPGIGKSAMLEALREHGWHVVVLYGSTLTDAADVVGVTVPGTREIGGVTYASMTHPLPDWMIDVMVAQSAGEDVVVVIDEATTAPADAMAALLGLLRDGFVAGSPMKPVRRIMIANPADCGANAWTLPAPIGNRVIHLELEVTASGVTEGFRGNWAPIVVPELPKDWESGVASAMGDVANFLTANGKFTHDMPENPDEQGLAWPSPRTWEMVARVQAAVTAAKASERTLDMLVDGAVGRVAGSQYIATLPKNRTPTWSTVMNFRNPENAAVAVLWCNSVADSAILTFHGENGTDQDGDPSWYSRDAWGAAWGYFETISKVYGYGVGKRAAGRMLGAVKAKGWRKLSIPAIFAKMQSTEEPGE